jgi:hypothetical protein
MALMNARVRNPMPQPRKKKPVGPVVIAGLSSRQAITLAMVRGLELPNRAGWSTRPQMRRLRERAVAAGMEDAVGWLAQVVTGEVAVESKEDVAELGKVLDRLLVALGW